MQSPFDSLSVAAKARTLCEATSTIFTPDVMLVRHSAVKPFLRSIYCPLTGSAARYEGASPKAGRYRYARHVALHRLRFGTTAALTSARSSDHSDIDWRKDEVRNPAPVDRLVACLVYVMPICEGLMRLAVVSIRIAQYNLLDWLIWTDLRDPAIDMATAHTLRQACQAVYTELSGVAIRLSLWAPPMPLITGERHGMPNIHASPANCGTLVSVIYISVVSLLAARTHQNQNATEKEPRHDCAGLHTSWLRLPRLVTATSACALMLRLSLVNLQGASGLAQDTYKFVAVSLTLATVCTSFAQLLQVAFGTFDDKNVFVQLVQQAGNIAWLHCALSLLEWILMLSTPGGWSAKLHVGLTVAITNFVVLAIRHKALQTDCRQ